MTKGRASVVFRATSLLAGSQLMATVVLFLRNVLVARLLSVEDFGIAATFAILWAVIETATNFAAQKLLVQSPMGEDPRFQDTLHLLGIVRALLSAGAMILLAGPYAAFVGTPDLVWAYQILALVPLLRGFLHLDIFRAQRAMDFRPQAVVIAGAPLVSLVSVGAIYLVYPDYRIMLGAIVVQQAAATVISHLLATRSFGLAWEPGYIRQSVGFGGPLLINGLLLMAVLQGERMLVANQTDLVTLGWFSAAFLLATAPGRLLPNTINGMFLPGLSRTAEATAGDGDAHLGQVLLLAEVSLYCGLWLAVGTAIVGPLVLVTFFGAEYAPGTVLLVILGLAQGVRTARTACSTLAMAAGRTWDILICGIVRGVGVLAGFWVLVQGLGVEALAWTGLGFEAAALLTGLALNVRHQGLPLARLGTALAAFAAVLGLVIWDLLAAPPSGRLAELAQPAQVGLAGVALLALLAMPRLRGLLRGRLARARRG